MSIETEYRGYNIRFSENEDEWRCYDAGDGIKHPKLSGVKAKIDSLLLAERKIGATMCFEIDKYRGCVSLTESTVIEYLGPKLERRNNIPFIAAQKVAVVSRRRGNTKSARREDTLDGLAPDSDETRAAWAEAQRLHVILAAAQKTYDAAVKAIPRLTLADIQPLVKISGLDPTGGIK